MAKTKPTPGNRMQGVHLKHPELCSPQTGLGRRGLRVLDGGLPTSPDWDLAPSPAGFEPDWSALPDERLDVPAERRGRAALLVLGIGRGRTPEELFDCISRELVDAFEDELEHDEALAHVDLLLEVLSPRPRPHDAQRVVQR